MITLHPEDPNSSWTPPSLWTLRQLVRRGKDIGYLFSLANKQILNYQLRQILHTQLFWCFLTFPADHSDFLGLDHKDKTRVKLLMNHLCRNSCPLRIIDWLGSKYSWTCHTSQHDTRRRSGELNIYCRKKVTGSNQRYAGHFSGRRLSAVLRLTTTSDQMKSCKFMSLQVEGSWLPICPFPFE